MLKVLIFLAVAAGLSALVVKQLMPDVQRYLSMRSM